MSLRTNNQRQAWININDLRIIRALKKVKQNGRMETDAEVVARLMRDLTKDVKDIQDQLKVKLDNKNLFK